MRSLLDRLKNRKLGQWAVAYLAAAWLVMQLVEVLGERWAWPLEVQRGADLLLLIGFCITLVLAWYHGERGLKKVSGPELLIIAVLLGIAGILLSLVRTNTEPSQDAESTSDRPRAGSTMEGSGDGRAASISRLNLLLPDSAPMAFLGNAPLGIGRHSIALSQDGSVIAFAALRSDGSTHLCLRPLRSFEVACLPETDGAFAPFFSPDGAWIGFFSRGQLLKIPSAGGEPVVLTEAPNPVGGNWIGADRIVWAGQDGSELFAIPSEGGVPQRLTLDSDSTPVENTNSLLYRSSPIPLPGGDVVLYSNNREVFAFDLSSGRITLVLRSAESPAFLPPNVLLFTRGADLMAVGFSPEDLRAVGNPVVLEEGIRVESQGSAQMTAARDGTVVFAAGEHAAAGRLTWVDRRSQTSTLPHPSEVFTKFQISPSGEEVAAGVLGATWDIWIYSLESEVSRRLTRDGNNERPAWSPDGELIYYRSDRGGSRQVYSQRADGSGSADVVLSGSVDYSPEDVSPSGDLLSYDRSRLGDWDLFVHRLREPPSSALIWSEEGVTEALARYSPDGEWIAFAADDLGQYEVYLGRADGLGRRHRVSPAGGEEPIWGPSGSELFFRNGQTLLSVSVSLGPGESVSVGAPQVLFALPGWVNTPGHSYDISPDGSRFLLALQDRDVSSRELRVLRDIRVLFPPEPEG